MAQAEGAGFTEALDRWTQRLGPLLTRSEAIDRLAGSAAAVDELDEGGRFVVLTSQAGTVRYPAWQFDLPARDRTVLADAHANIVRLGRVSPWTAASWLTTPHPGLEALTPIAYLTHGGDPARVVAAARRDAARLGD